MNDKETLVNKIRLAICKWLQGLADQMGQRPYRQEAREQEEPVRGTVTVAPLGAELTITVSGDNGAISAGTTDTYRVTGDEQVSLTK